MLPTIAGLGMAGMAQAALLVYEGFNYTSGTAGGPTGNGFQLNGQSGGTGMTGTWTAFTNSTGTTSPITVYSEGNLSGVNLSTDNPLAYDGTVANLPTTGGYFGMGNTNGAATGSTDHMIISRPLATSVTSTFVDGATTWFSFVSVRGSTANPAGMKLALGKGALLEDRGNVSTGEAIGGGGGLGSSVKNGYKVYPQFWDSTTASPGETTGTFSNYDVTGLNNNGATALTAPWLAEGYTSAPSGQADGLQSMLLDYDDPDGPGGNIPAQPNGARNIIIGKIEWKDGAPDVITTVVFEEGDSLTEAAFNALVVAQPLLSSAGWATQPDLDQSQFDTISLAGGKWFGDEVRLATTFSDVIGAEAIPEPSAVLLSLLGVGAFLRRRR